MSDPSALVVTIHPMNREDGKFPVSLAKYQKGSLRLEYFGVTLEESESEQERYAKSLAEFMGINVIRVDTFGVLM